MAISIPGTASAAATSVTLPTHQAGDLILICAIGGVAPTVPSAGGTVPTWDAIQSGAADALGMTTRCALATAANHTSGTWANATHIAAIVFRGTGTLSLGASNTKNGPAVASHTYPSLTLQDGDGSSMGVRTVGRGIGSASVDNLAAGGAGETWTMQVFVTGSRLALHTSAGLSVNPVEDTVATVGNTSAYRAHTIEIKETIAAAGGAQGRLGVGLGVGL